MRGRPAIVLGMLVWLVSGPAQAGEDRSLVQLFHQSWGLRQGVPGTVLDLAQTVDGYLWLASPAGLYRFDGVRFERYVPRSGTLPKRIVRLLSDPRGGLWVCAGGGAVALVRNDQASGAAIERALTAWDFALDASGGVWAATTDGFFRFDGSRWDLIAADWNMPAGPAHAVLASPRGTVWALASAGLFRLTSSAHRFEHVVPLDPADPISVVGLAEAPDGTVWLSDGRGSTRPVARADGTPTEAPGIPHGARRVRFDRHGALWVQSDNGLVRATFRTGAPVIERFGTAQGLSGDNTFTLLDDREGNIWAGTSGGLDFFRETALVGAPLPPGTHAIRLAPDDTGGLWVGSQNRALMRLRANAVATLDVPPPVTSVTHDPLGRTWAWAANRLWRIDRDGRSVPFPPPPDFTKGEAWSLAADGQGRLWATFLRRGLYLYQDGAWSRAAQLGLPSGVEIRLVFVDDDGRTWLTHDNAVTMVDGEHTRTFTEADGLKTSRLSAIAVGAGRLWLGGDSGLAFFDGTAIHMVSGIDSDSVGRITGVVEAVDGSVWLNADRGVVRLSREDVLKSVANPSEAPVFRVFDYLDGVIGGAAPIPPQSAGKSTDGRLWFVGFDNLVWIDPSAVATNAVPPPVHIQSLASGPTMYPLEPDLRLQARASNIHIRYTALSLAMPERVRFRYRLDGVDDDWQDAGSRREAFYTNLAPGSYRFRVIAANNDGVWNETGATQAFTIPYAFYQKTWFKAFAAAAALGAAWMLYRRQVRQLRAQMHERIEERLNERERIARELHDTLLQGFQGLILRFQAVATRIPPSDPTYALMEDALTRADDVLVEGRDRVRGLRGAAGSMAQLPDALTRVGEELARGGSAAFQVTVDGEPRPLHPVVRDEVYWIGREALLNAFRHGEAQRVEVEITFGGRELRVRLRDDGKGLEEAVLKSGARAQHWGLPGMRERAARIGASLDIWSRQGAGTAIELRVPARLAYREVTAARGWRPWSRTTRGAIDGHE